MNDDDMLRYRDSFRDRLNNSTISDIELIRFRNIPSDKFKLFIVVDATGFVTDFIKIESW